MGILFLEHFPKQLASVDSMCQLKQAPPNMETLSVLGHGIGINTQSRMIKLYNHIQIARLPDILQSCIYHCSLAYSSACYVTSVDMNSCKNHNTKCMHRFWLQFRSTNFTYGLLVYLELLLKRKNSLRKFFFIDSHCTTLSPLYPLSCETFAV